MAGFLVGLLVPWAAAFALLCRLWPGPRPAGALPLLACLASGCGLGLSSCTLFAWRVLFGIPGVGYCVAESGLFLLVTAALIWTRPRSEGALAEPPALPPTDWSRALVFLFGLAFLLQVIQFVLYSFYFPHGHGDAWFTWNMRARYLYRAGEHWTDAFSNLLGEGVGDYPLLVPLSVARGWLYAGAEVLWVQAAVAGVFTFATVGSLGAGLAVLRGLGQGAVAGLLLLGTQFYLFLGSSQVADIPVGFFFLAAGMLLALHEATAPRPGLLAAAGLLAGCAAWTKNDGALLALALVAARLLVGRRTPQADGTAVGVTLRQRLAELVPLALGALPVLAVLVYFKMRLAPPSYLVEGQGWDATLDRLTTYSRYRLILVGFVMRLVQLGGPGLGMGWGSGAVLLLVAYRILLGRSPDGPHRAPLRFLGLSVTLGLLGYALVYLTTPIDLAGQLYSSLSRLLLHLWPLTLFLFGLGVATPEEALKGREGSAG